MKVNRLEMLIKFAAIYLCLNLVVLSVAAVPLSSEQQNADKESSGGASKEDYDEVENTSEHASPPPAEGEVADTKPPLVFPESESAQTITTNATALEILQSNTPMANNTVEDSASSSNSSGDSEKREDENNGSSQTQVDNNNNNIANNDSKNASKEADYDDHAETEEKNATVNGTGENDAKKEKDYDEPASDDSGDDEDVENFQEESQNQGDLEETFGLNSTSINVFEEPTLKGGHIALIFASSLIILSAAAYVGMVLWRKSLEQRYGMRQRLVTEDDFYNNNDVRFFGL